LFDVITKDGDGRALIAQSGDKATLALKRLGAGKEAFADLAEEVAKLHRRKAELQAAQSHVVSPSPAGSQNA
jgi:hypothetical protein